MPDLLEKTFLASVMVWMARFLNIVAVILGQDGLFSYQSLRWNGEIETVVLIDFLFE